MADTEYQAGGRLAGRSGEEKFVASPLPKLAPLLLKALRGAQSIKRAFRGVP